jgi:acylpyruvate hydrolase
MRIARVRAATGPVMAVIEGDDVLEAEVDGHEFDDLPALLEACGGDFTRIRPGARFGALNQNELMAPVGRPRKIICIGLNYRQHAAEVGLELPKAPPIFAKWDNALVGPYHDAPIPARTHALDFESELAFVISRTCRNVAAEDTASVLLGYTCANDVSARDLQNQTTQWGAGKAFDGSCPLGPWIVTVDEIGPNPDLAIRGRLEGELMQDSRTSDFIYGVPELVTFLTSIMTLDPGDVVLTGTPAGVGTARRPRRFIQPGETYEVEIEGIGSLRNRFVPE